MGIARIRAVVLDGPDPHRLADFYGALLDWKTTTVEDDWVTIEGTGEAERISFQKAPDHRPPDWPDPARPQQFHLDLTVDDLDEAEAAVLALGGVKHTHQPDETGSFRVYLDPAGHPFCLCVD
ncbi:VOC family protein [Planomonospora sp. ID82291]|uniref:VOC family protein n=1 Tax=Planomonospora sp. ID82291 TaxID=2738136 RepID=UPI0018C352F5|nr:VOC family protein [Planomonospora sp. ID82291]MBG0812702.1 VOC family protein [Planomonospora sp. ID82291]